MRLLWATRAFATSCNPGRDAELCLTCGTDERFRELSFPLLKKQQLLQVTLLPEVKDAWQRVRWNLVPFGGGSRGMWAKGPVYVWSLPPLRNWKIAKGWGSICSGFRDHPCPAAPPWAQPTASPSVTQPAYWWLRPELLFLLVSSMKGYLWWSTARQGSESERIRDLPRGP